MEVCPSCGAENPTGTWRCARCGKVLPHDDTSLTPSRQSSLVNDIALGVFIGLAAWSLVSGVIGAIIWYAIAHS